jgi:hypothetical protein
MSNCQFTIAFSGEAENIVEKAKSAVVSQGGFFEGDTIQGKFSISLMSNTVTGSYVVEGNQLTMTITEKPIFLPCGAIEGYLSNKLK